MVDSKIGYIKLLSFTMNSGTKFKKTFEDLQKENPDMEGLIIDLRGNPGGLLNEAVNLVNIFVDKGITVVQTKGRLKDSNKTYKTLNNATDKKIRLAVLIDGSSASASEISAGFIQDVDRGVIVGQKSFGKGLVQNVIPSITILVFKSLLLKFTFQADVAFSLLTIQKNQREAINYSDSLKQKFQLKTVDLFLMLEEFYLI